MNFENFRIHTLLFVMALAVSLIGVIRIAALPEEQFIANVIIDDAFYYVIPAQNFFEGNDYSFDREHRTNGVQPLWALISLILVILIPDKLAILRTLVLLSGLCWILAGVVLYRSLYLFRPSIATVAAIGFILTGFWNRVALMGMENGLHALLWALLIAYGIKKLYFSKASPTNDRAFFFGLGFLVALVVLTRLDNGPLILILGGLIWIGLLRPSHHSALYFNWSGIIWFGIPILFLLGSWLLFSKAYFGEFMPISGQVKLYYSSQAPNPYGGGWASIIWHARYLFDITSSPISANLELSLWRSLTLVWPAYRTRLAMLTIVLIGYFGGLPLILRNIKHIYLASWFIYISALIAFILLHFSLLVLLWPLYTQYGTWYFSPEFLAFWIAYTIGVYLFGKEVLGPLGRVFLGGIDIKRILADSMLTGVALLLVICSFIPIYSHPALDPRISMFLVAARFMNEYLPAGQRIGTFSSGIVGYYATNHRVYNLDGLMNNAEYFNHYIKQNRIPEYAEREEISYVADYAPIATWRNGIWGFSIERMQLLRWWRMSDEWNGDLAYCIWKLLPESEHRDILDPCKGFCDRVSQIQFAAEVLNRYQLIEEEQLDEFLNRPEAINLRVVTSIIIYPSMRLKHVIIPLDEVDKLDLNPELLHIPLKLNVTFGDAFRLVGVDLPIRSVRRGGRLVISRYWESLTDSYTFQDVSFELWIYPSRPQDFDRIPTSHRLIHQTRGCHGTCPVQNWRKGEIIIETYSIPVPLTIPPGRYPIMLGLWGSKTGWLAPDHISNENSSLIFIGNIEVR